MDFFTRADLYIFSFGMLVFLLVYFLITAPQKTPSKKLFIIIVAVLMLQNALSILTCISNGNPEPWAVSFSKWTNSLLLAFSFLPVVAWTAYIDYSLMHNLRNMIKRTVYYLIPFYIIAVMMIINSYTGFIFTIENGVFTQHSGIYIAHGIVYAALFALIVLSYKNKNLLKVHVIRKMLIFMMFPMAANVIKFIFPNINLVWPAFTLTTFMIFIVLEKDAMLKDSLTKLNTRISLETRIRQKLKRKEPFSLIMIDLDNFKSINDSFGHKSGDDALLVVASILEESVKRTDMVCRYGGDEFLILVESTRANAARYIRDRIKSKVSAFNKKKVKPYIVAMSFGIKFCGKGSSNLKLIMNEVDRLMYIDKEKNRRLAEAMQKNLPENLTGA